MKKDLFNECFDKKMPPKEFQSTFCDRCRNSLCQRSKFGNFSWAEKMLTQMDNLFFNVERANPLDPKYKDVVAAKFESFLPEANTIEVSLKGWEIPEIPILDGVVKPVSEESQKNFEESLQTLLGNKNSSEKEKKKVPSPVQPIQDDVLEKEWLDDSSQGEDVSVEKKETPKKPLPQKNEKMTNTVTPVGGHIIGDDPLPQPSSRKGAQETWEPPKDIIIPVGGTITIPKKSS